MSQRKSMSSCHKNFISTPLPYGDPLRRYVVSVQHRDQGSLGSFVWFWLTFYTDSEDKAREKMLQFLQLKNQETCGVLSQEWPPHTAPPKPPEEVAYERGAWPEAIQRSSEE